MVEFFKQIVFLKSLSTQSIVKIQLNFTPHRMDKAGCVVLREGDPVTHIAIVISGEFELFKRSVKGLDDRIMSFLKKNDVRKRIARQVMMLPGRSTIFQKTSHLIPPYERANNETFLNKKESELEDLAFNSVSEELYDIAKDQMTSSKQQHVSLNQMKRSVVDKYRDLRISIQGVGYVFGDYDCFTN
mmetsp:Transcript_25026/g.33552  ORF Transcript_25026/g.33552 Transcript_25026/m.33552 type:complete len:187 (+) Transcript_25026:705-1265(+)